MPERQRLAVERFALIAFDWYRKYGRVVREGKSFPAKYEGHCIECGLPIHIVDPVHHAYWANRKQTGFVAHVLCPSLRRISDWLNDDHFATMWMHKPDAATQNCKYHGHQVIGQFVHNETGDMFWGCEECRA